MLAVLLVVLLVVVLLSCCCHGLHLLCCRVANTAAAATVGMPPPPPPPSVGKEDDACYTNTASSPATLAQAVCRVLEFHTSLDRPLPAGCAGGKGSDDDGGAGGGGQSRIAHRIGMVLPIPHPRWGDSNKHGRRVKADATKRAIAMATRVASNDDGDDNSGKSNGNCDEDAG